jgi:hypothetical protein
MKTKIRNLGNNCYKLVIDQSGIAPKDMPVLARIDNHFSAGCWSIEDLRLGQFMSASPYFTVSAEKYNSNFLANNSDEAAMVRSMLRSFEEEKIDSAVAVKFDWCTYEGLFPGKRSVDMNVNVGHLVNGAPLFHTRKDALSYLEHLVVFWSLQPISELTEDLVKVNSVKIENPLRQSTETDVSMAIMGLRLKAEACQPKVKSTKLRLG